MTEVIGWSGACNNTDYGLQNTVRGFCWTADKDYTLDGTAFARIDGFTAGGGDEVRIGIYISGGTKQLVAQSTSIDGPDDEAGDKWAVGSIGASSLTSGTDYLFVVWGDTAGKNMCHKTENGARRFYCGVAYNDHDYDASGNGDFAQYFPTYDMFKNFGWVSNNLVPLIFFEATEDGGPGPGPGGDYTTYKCIIGSEIGWAWNSGQFNTDESMRGTSSTPTGFSWTYVSSSVNYFYKAGSPTGWAWKSGNAA